MRCKEALQLSPHATDSTSRQRKTDLRFPFWSQSGRLLACMSSRNPGGTAGLHPSRGEMDGLICISHGM